MRSSRLTRLLALCAVLAPIQLVAPLGAAWATAIPHHELSVSLNPASRALVVEDKIAVQGIPVIEFALGRAFTLQQVLVDGSPAKGSQQPARPQRNRWRIALGPSTQVRTVVVRYRGRLEPLPAADHREVLRGLPPMADIRGSFLPGGSGWYPEIKAASFTYQVRLDLPADQRGLVPGRLVNERVEGGRYRATFSFAHPAESIDLIAGPYQVAERIVQPDSGNPLRLRTYFHPELEDLASEYLSAVGRYVDLYSRWIGPYPFTEFSVVSSPLPTGFGMPTLTYLGVDVLRLPFIRRTSLGHEILHNWWGNGVYVDFARGNWSEALTAFMADYTYKEREGADAGRQTRLEMLGDIAAIPPGQDTPLRQFTSRSHGTSQIVGYHKGALLFLMLRDLIGPAAFDAGLQRFWREQQFRRASWADLQRAFEQASSRDLGQFFVQWLSRRGAPHFAVETARAERAASGYQVRLTLAQAEPAYVVTLPVVVATTAGPEEHRIALTAGQQECVLAVSAPPLSVTLDPGFRVLRQLDPVEVPPILRQVILDPTTATIVATPDGAVRAAAMELAHRLLDYQPRLGEPAAPPVGVPLLVIGLTADVDRFLGQSKLPARPEPVKGRGTAQVWTAYQPHGRVLAVVSAENVEALSALWRPLPHYGRESYLIFDGPRAVDHGVWPTRSREWRFSQDGTSDAGGQRILDASFVGGSSEVLRKYPLRTVFALE